MAKTWKPRPPKIGMRCTLGNFLPDLPWRRDKTQPIGFPDRLFDDEDVHAHWWEDDMIAIECVVYNPPSMHGRSVLLCLNSEQIVKLMGELRRRAADSRSQPMTPRSETLA